MSKIIYAPMLITVMLTAACQSKSGGKKGTTNAQTTSTSVTITSPITSTSTSTMTNTSSVINAGLTCTLTNVTSGDSKTVTFDLTSSPNRMQIKYSSGDIQTFNMTPTKSLKLLLYPGWDKFEVTDSTSNLTGLVAIDPNTKNAIGVERKSGFRVASFIGVPLSYGSLTSMSGKADCQ